MESITLESKKGQILADKKEAILAEMEKELNSPETEKLLLSVDEGVNISEKEVSLVKLKNNLTNAFARAALKETGYRGAMIFCECGCKAKFVRYDYKNLNLLLGSVDLKRALYRCQGCGRYWRPLDSDWGLPAGHNSEGVERVAALLGAYMPFETAEEVLQETAGVTLSDSSIRSISEAIGAEIETITQVEVEKSQKEDPPETQAEIMAIYTDGAMVNTREEQWKEVKVGAVASFNRTGPKQIKLDRTTYTAYLGGVEEFKPRLWAEGFRRGVQGKEATLFLGDGSPWVWNLADELFPHAIQVLDYWHLCENVWKASHLIFIDEEEKRHWVENITEKMLRQGKVDEAIKTIKSTTIRTEEEKKAVETLLGYIENTRKRINYPFLEQKGYPIGSGIIESACKRIVGARHKQAGMRWSKTGVQKMLNLVSFIHSKRWDHYWKVLRRAS